MLTFDCRFTPLMLTIFAAADAYASFSTPEAPYFSMPRRCPMFIEVSRRLRFFFFAAAMMSCCFMPCYAILVYAHVITRYFSSPAAPAVTRFIRALLMPRMSCRLMPISADMPRTMPPLLSHARHHAASRRFSAIVMPRLRLRVSVTRHDAADARACRDALYAVVMIYMIMSYSYFFLLLPMSPRCHRHFDTPALMRACAFTLPPFSCRRRFRCLIRCRMRHYAPLTPFSPAATR